MRLYCSLEKNHYYLVMDKFTTEKRSWIMAQVRGRNTKPEKAVRSLLHRLGYRFRIQRKDLPGTPDIVLPKYKTVIFVHGCFWHRHLNCPRATMPASNQTYWQKKFESNCRRDEMNHALLKQLGWNVVVVWECELKNLETLADKLSTHLSSIELLTPMFRQN